MRIRVEKNMSRRCAFFELNTFSYLLSIFSLYTMADNIWFVLFFSFTGCLSILIGYLVYRGTKRNEQDHGT